MQGSLLISRNKFMDFDPDRKDRFGVPMPRIHLHYEDSDLAMVQDLVNCFPSLPLPVSPARNTTIIGPRWRLPTHTNCKSSPRSRTRFSTCWPI